MGKGIARIGQDYCGGKLTTNPRTTVYVNNKMGAVKGQTIEPHIPCGTPGGAAHCFATVNEGSRTVYFNNKGVARKDDKGTCGTHKITSASRNVYAD